MIRHGPTWPRAEASALGLTGQAVLDAGSTRIGTDFGAPCSNSSDHCSATIWMRIVLPHRRMLPALRRLPHQNAPEAS